MPQLLDYAHVALKHVAGILGPSSAYILLALVSTYILRAICLKRGAPLTQTKSTTTLEPRHDFWGIIEKCIIYCVIIIISHGFDVITNLGSGIQRAAMSLLLLEESMSILTYLSLLGYSRLTSLLEALYVKHTCNEIKRATQDVISQFTPSDSACDTTNDNGMSTDVSCYIAIECQG